MKRNKKVPGIDSIEGEVLKRGEEVMVNILARLFNQIIETEIVPTNCLSDCYDNTQKKR